MTLTEPTTGADTALKDGKVVAIAGPVVDVEFPADAVPAINTALEMTIKAGDGRHRRPGRGRPADRRQPGAGRVPAADRRHGPRHARHQPGRTA